MASDLKLSSIDFGVVIAFVAPGFVAFQAISYHMPTAGAWMSAASERDQSVGVFLFVLLASLSLGLVVSGVRALVIDKLFCWPRLPWGLSVQHYTIDWSKVDENKLLVLTTIRDNFYRYYQFYSNSVVALVVWALARSYSTEPYLSCLQIALIVGGIVALLLSSRQSLHLYVTALEKVFQS